eukprot:546554-Rhodomonas_salina.1
MEPYQGVRSPLSAYACYVMSGTDTAYGLICVIGYLYYGTICLCACYAMSGTGLANGLCTYAMSGTDLAYGATRRYSPSRSHAKVPHPYPTRYLCNVRYLHSA